MVWKLICYPIRLRPKRVLYIPMFLRCSAKIVLPPRIKLKPSSNNMYNELNEINITKRMKAQRRNAALMRK